MTELFEVRGGGGHSTGSWEDKGDCWDKGIRNYYKQRSLV